MTSNLAELKRIHEIREDINMAAENKMFLPKNLAKPSWRAFDKEGANIESMTVQMDYLETRTHEELDEFIENPSADEAGDVMNFMAMIIDNTANAYICSGCGTGFSGYGILAAHKERTGH